MSAFPSLPLFTDSFIADTGHLSAQETGAYLMLLMMAWRLPDCCLPDDDARLARWARVDARTWRRLKPTVMEFWSLSDGRWTQKRLMKEREIVSKRAEVARDNGKHGGRPKSLSAHNMTNPAGSSRVTHEKAPNPNPRREPDGSPPPMAPPQADGGAGKAPTPAMTSRKRAAVPFPADWTAPDERHVAEAQALGLAAGDVAAEFQQFRDHAFANDRRMADWRACWRTWCGKAVSWRSRSPPAVVPFRPTRKTTGVLDALDRFIADLDEPGPIGRAGERN